MGTAVIITVLTIIIIIAVKGSVKHMLGQGGCCGGSDVSPKKIKAAKLDKIIATKILEIDGMHCKNCANTVSNALNSVPGISAKVSLDKKEATVNLACEMSDNELKEIVRKAGYVVVNVK